MRFFFYDLYFFFEKVKAICEIVDVWKFKPHNFNTRRSIFESPKQVFWNQWTIWQLILILKYHPSLMRSWLFRQIYDFTGVDIKNSEKQHLIWYTECHEIAFQISGTVLNRAMKARIDTWNGEKWQALLHELLITLDDRVLLSKISIELQPIFLLYL